MSSAADITRRAKSNLAFALRVLPPDRRDDATVFYAFCRTIDDLADDLSRPPDQRARGLDAWSDGLRDGFENPGELESSVLALLGRRAIPKDLLLAIIDGCRADLHPQRFATWEALQEYNWKVACAVGLVSLRIFGAEDPASERYAVALGHALQLTNILRDVGEDLDNDTRIYLPLDDLQRHGYSEEDLVARVHDDRFLALMNFEADRAEELFAQAAALLPASDRRALLPAEIMREIYSTLLAKMRRDGFRVLDRRYSISAARKLAILSKHLVTDR
jgi:phytoene synthase